MSRTAVTQVQSGVSCIRPAFRPTARSTIDSRALPRNAARSTPGENSQRLPGTFPADRAAARGIVSVLIPLLQNRYGVQPAGSQDLFGSADALVEGFLHDTDPAQIRVGKMDVAVGLGELATAAAPDRAWL